MADLGDLVVKVGANVEGFRDAMQEIPEHFMGVLDKINPAIAGVVTAIVGIGTAAVDAALVYEEAFDHIQTHTSATGEELVALKEDFKAVFLNVPEDATKVSDALSEIHNRLGLTGEALQENTTRFADLARVTGEDLHPLVVSTTQAFNDWKISADELGEAQNFLLGVFRATSAPVTEVSSKLAEFGPTLRQLGLDYKDAAAFIGQLQQLGPGATEAMTGLKKAVANLTEAGIPAKGALEGIISAIKNAPNDTAAASEAMEIFGKKVGSKLAEEIRAGKFDLDALMEKIKSSPMDVSELAKETDNLGEKFSKLWHHVLDLLEPFGTVLVDAAKSVLDAFNGLFGSVDGVGGAIGELKELVKPLADLFTNELKPTLLDVVDLVKGLEEKTGLLKTAFGFLLDVLKFAATTFIDNVKAPIEAINTTVSNFLTILKAIPGAASLFASAQQDMNAALKEGATQTTSAEASAVLLHIAHKELADKTTDATAAQKTLKDELGNAAAKAIASQLATKTLNEELGKAEKNVNAVKKAYDLHAASAEDVRKAQDKVNEILLKLHPQWKTQEADVRLVEAALKSAQGALADTKKGYENHVRTAQDVAEAESKVRGILLLLHPEWKLEESTMAAATESAAELQKSMERLGEELLKVDANTANLGGKVFPDYVVAATPAQAATMALESAFRQLGITSQSELTKLALKSQESYATISSDATASATQVREAHIVALRDMADAYAASGSNVPAAQQIMLAKLEQQERDYVGNAIKRWKNLYEDIHNTVEGMFDGLIKDLFEGGDFLQTITRTFQRIGEDMVSTILKPFTTAFENWISEKLTSLLSGAFDTVFGTGGVLGTGVGAGAGAGGSIPGVPGTGSSGGGGGGAGGAAGAASGLTGWITAISSAVTAISSVLSLFGVGEGGQKDRLNIIANNTSFLAWAFDQGGLHTAILDIRNDTKYFLGAFTTWYADLIAGMADSISNIDTYTRKLASSVSDSLEAVDDTPIPEGTPLDLSGMMTVGRMLVQAIEKSSLQILDGLRDLSAALVDGVTVKSAPAAPPPPQPPSVQFVNMLGPISVPTDNPFVNMEQLLKDILAASEVESSVLNDLTHASLEVANGLKSGLAYVGEAILYAGDAIVDALDPGRFMKTPPIVINIQGNVIGTRENIEQLSEAIAAELRLQGAFA